MTMVRSASRTAAVLAGAALVFAPTVATAVPQARRSVPITLPLSFAPVPAINGGEASGYHRWRGYRHRGGIDGGDLLGGLLIIGAVAAAAKAIDRDQEERRRDRTRGRDYPYNGTYRDRPYDYRSGERADGSTRYGGGDPREADRAVDACSAEAGRSGRVDEVFEVENVAGEWQVKGDFTNGRRFTCTVDASGRAYVGTDWGAEVDPRPVVGRDADDRYGAGAAPDLAARGH